MMHQQSLLENVLEILPPDKWTQHTVLVGCSGGADSVAMLRLVQEISLEQGLGKVVVCHANHQMRGRESDDDEKFVGNLCDQLGIELVSARLPISLETTTDGVEASLRALRYQLFRQAADQFAARYVLTAHTADDQTETLLFRLLRGTGISGLAGIPEQRPLCEGVTLVRPMLKIHRVEITNYLAAIEQEYRSDSSNSQMNYSRNKIRHQLIPFLQSDFECEIGQRLQPLSQQANEYTKLLDQLSQPCLDAAVVNFGTSVSLNTKGLNDLPIPVLRHLLIRIWQQKQWPLQAMTFQKWQQLAEFAASSQEKGQPPKLTLPGNISASRDEDQITLIKR